MAIVGQYFQIPINASNPMDDVLAWLATAPIAALPYWIWLDLNKELDHEVLESIVSRLHNARARIYWRLTLITKSRLPITTCATIATTTTKVTTRRVVGVNSVVVAATIIAARTGIITTA